MQSCVMSRGDVTTQKLSKAFDRARHLAMKQLA